MRSFKLVTTLTLLSGIISGQAMAADPVSVHGGTVKFEGSIVNAPCAVDVNSASQTVNLGQYRADSFDKTGSVSAPVNFNIDLIDCSTESYKTAAIKFNGPTVDGKNTALTPVANQAADTTADGVGIQILQDGKALAVDGSESSTAKTFTETGGRLSFQAQYIALTDNVVPGSTNTSADFTVTYE